MQLTADRPSHIPQPRSSSVARLLDGHGFSQISWEINVEPFAHREPVGDELQGDHVQQTLQTIHRVRDFDLLGLLRREFLVVGIANDNGAATSGND